MLFYEITLVNVSVTLDRFLLSREHVTRAVLMHIELNLISFSDFAQTFLCSTTQEISS